MKLKMSDNSLFAILLRSPWWISIAIAGLFVLVAKTWLAPEYVPFGAMGGLPFLVIGVMAAWRQWRAPNPEHIARTLDRVGLMPWAEFSAHLVTALRRQGYVVDAVNAGAVDFQLSRAGQVTLVQCKRWKAASLGIEPLRELVAARQARQADAAMVMTMGKLSDSARQFAKDHQVQVMTPQELAQLMSTP